MIHKNTTLIRSVVLTATICGVGLLADANVSTAENLVDIVPDETVDSSVQLTPGFISGVVDLGGQNVRRVDLSAISTDYAAKIYPTSEGPYTLTVNVPEGSSLDYKVSGTVYMDNWNTRMFFKDKTVAVTEGQTSNLDFVVNSGYVSGEFVTDGCAIAKSEIWAVKNDAAGFTKATTKLGSETQFRFPAQPNQSVKVYGQVQLATGQTYSLEERVVNVPAGQDALVNWQFNCVAGQLSNIRHQVDYHMPIDYHYTHLYNQGSWSPYRTLKHEGTTLFDNLAPSTWRLYTYSYWNNNQNLVAKNFTNITTTAGNTTDVVFDQYPGFMRGKLNLTGTHTIADTSYAHVYAYGENAGYPSDQVYSRALANKTDGSFNLALPQGEYRSYVSAYAFYNPELGADYINSYMYMYDYSKRSKLTYIDAEQVIEGQDINYETGSAIIKFSRADGGVFTSPYLVAKNYTYDENNSLQSYAYTNSRGYSNTDKVTMVGFPGTYQVEAWAYVDGSLTTFGKVEIEIVPGVEKVIDIGGPQLSVSNPAAGTVFEESNVTVTGLATDESGVESITVNGVVVEFTSTNNPEDENEVTFTVAVELEEGENTISTVAKDISGNESSDNRTVSYVVPEDEVQTISGFLDIKPGSCKNPFNVTAKGVLPVVLLGSDNMDVSAIKTDSLLLNGVAPVRTVIDDAAALTEEGACETDFADGYNDLVMKFDRQAIVAAIGDVEDGEVVTLTLTGSSFGDEAIEADDIITIIDNTKGGTTTIPAKGKKKK